MCDLKTWSNKNATSKNLALARCVEDREVAAGIPDDASESVLPFLTVDRMEGGPEHRFAFSSCGNDSSINGQTETQTDSRRKTRTEKAA